MKHIKLFEQFANEAMKANWKDLDIKKAIGETIKGVKFLTSNNQDYVTILFKSNKSLVIFAEASPQDEEAYVLVEDDKNLSTMKGKTISNIDSKELDEIEIKFDDNSDIKFYADTTGESADLVYSFK